MVPLFSGLIINTKNISYPENVDKENMILVSTPTFLSSIPKFDISFKKPPKYIFSAGSKLNENIFEFLKRDSEVVEIYGSTETGVIGYKTHWNDDFKLFEKVNLIPKTESVNVISDFVYEHQVTINDKIELNGRNFKIINRADRLFKIYEKRVSADELEIYLKKNEYVSDCYITKHGEKLVCLCALSQQGKEYLLQENISFLTKKLKQYLLKYSEIVPQKWKYIDQIPMTKIGKINKKLVEHMFDINLSLPVILDRNVSENSIIYKVLFYKHCNFFKGHFPQFNIVPGVTQLYLAKEFAKAHFDLFIGEGQYKRIKFSNIIKPDSIINLRLEKNNKQILYELYSEEKKYASGVFLCENTLKECN